MDAELGDAYELFSRGMQEAGSDSPYPQYAALRRIGPVVEKFPDGTFGIPAAEASKTTTRRFYAVTHEAVTHVLKDAETFSSRIISPRLWMVIGQSMVNMDDPQHGQYRALIRSFFSPSRIEAWERECIRPLVRQLIDELVEKGHADLLKDFTFRLPVRVISRIIGYRVADISRIHLWALQLLNPARDLETALAASTALSQYLQGIVVERREAPCDDLPSYLIQAELNGRPLSDHEILSLLLMLTPTGFETTFRSLTNLLFGLLTHPAQLEALRADPSLMLQALEEGLRWGTSDLRLMRRCVRDTEVCGVFIPAGTVVHACIASANRDEAVFGNADSFDIFRPRSPHLSFSVGAHFCLGARLSRIEISASIEELLKRLPGLRLDPSWNDRYIRGDIFRGPTRLPVLF